MSAETLQRLLLFDRLERVLVNPTAGTEWQALVAAYEQTPDDETRAVVRDALGADEIKDEIGGFFRATFLADKPGGRAYAAEAGRLVRGIRPVDPDRLMAFAAFEWGSALASVGGRGAFVDRLRAAQLPEVVAMAGAELARRGDRLPRRQIDSVRKVALVAPFLGQPDHPPTILALHQARLLLQAGKEVAAFACQEALMPRMSGYLGNSGQVIATAPDIDQLATLAPEGLTISLSDPDFSLMHRWREMLGAIAKFDPDLVLFVGLISPLITPLHADRPVLGLCTQSVAPLTPVDAWLCADEALAGRLSAPWAPAIPAAWGAHYPYRTALAPVAAPVSRAQLQVSDQDLVLVSAGARLTEEIAGDWAARIAGLLAARPGCVWLLVGGAAELPPALAGLAPERLRLVPQQEGLRGLLRCCDLYINPARLGGGLSVAEAMAEGLPAVALADSDGGDKLGVHASPNIDAYFSQVAALIESPALRKDLGAALQSRFFDALDLERSGPSLLAACDTALARARDRLDPR